jgi:hypothetical protein
MKNQAKKEVAKNMIPKGAKFEWDIEGKICYLSSISRQVVETALGMIMPTSGAPRLITAGEIILNSCWLGGDEEIRKDDDLLIEACLQCVSLIERKSATLKKL